MFQFTQTGVEGSNLTPYYEDAKTAYAPYYSTSKSVETAIKEIKAEMSKLGGFITQVAEGYFKDDQKRTRYGFTIRFNYVGQPGILRVAGLPLRRETARKAEQVKAQALLNVRDWLKAAYTAQVFNPGADTLMLYLLVDRTNELTVADFIKREGNLPSLRPMETLTDALPAPMEMEGEVVDEST
jgi:hypothetical protein